MKNNSKLIKVLLLSAFATTGISSLTACGEVEQKEEEKQEEVVTIDAESISLDKKTITIEEGLNALLQCTVLPENATDKVVLWTSLDETIATVSKAGVVHAVKEGTTQIKVTHSLGWIDRCSVTVTKAEEPAPEGTTLYLDKSELSLSSGEDTTLVATLTPETLTDKTLSWSSTNPFVATVDSNGKVTALEGGTATIIVSHGPYVAKCVVTVAPKDIEFTDKGNVSIYNETVKTYLGLTSPKEEYDFLKTHTNTKSTDAENDNQVYVTSWEDDGSDKYRVVLSNNEDLTKPLFDKEIESTSFNYGLYTPGETYYMFVSSENSKVLKAEKFTINPNEIRFVNVPNAKNIRDFGGWSVGEDNINYKLLYRGGCLNGKGAGKLNEEGIDIFNNDLKIKTEIDFRAYNSESSGYQTNAYFNDDANYVTVDFKEQRFDNVIKDKTLNLKDSVKKMFDTLANKNNYPMYMHCNEGASRTGTAAFLVEAVLGVSYEDMVRDYELTNFSQSGSKRWRTHAYDEVDGFKDLTNLSYEELIKTTPNAETGRTSCSYNIDAMYVYLMENYKKSGSTIKDAVVNYLLDCGVTQESIDSFRSIMFTDGVYEEVTKEEQSEEDKTLVFVTLTGLNGGDVIVPVQKGKKLELSTPKESKKIFDKWLLNDEPFDMNTLINEDITISASWKEYSDVPTDNKITVFELTKEEGTKIIGSEGKADKSDDMIEFYELKNAKEVVKLPKIKFSNYKFVEFDVMNNWQFAFLSFGSSESDLVQFGNNATRYRYTIKIDCETGKMYVTKIFNVANSSVVSSDTTEINYSLNENQLEGYTPLVLGYNSSGADTFGFKLTSLFTYIK